MLDRYCIGCHGLGTKKNKISLLGTMGKRGDFNKTYRTMHGSQAYLSLAQPPFAALVNIAIPSESRILKAPLAVSAGGWGQVDQGGWRNRDDPSCTKMLELVRRRGVVCAFLVHQSAVQVQDLKDGLVKQVNGMFPVERDR